MRIYRVLGIAGKGGGFSGKIGVFGGWKVGVSGGLEIKRGAF